MITVFNRAELEITSSMKRQWEIRHALAANSIEYKLIVKGRYALRSHDFRAPSDNPDDGIYVYCFYVKEKDLPEARRLVGIH